MTDPADNSEKIGVLLANLGTPDGTGYWAMRRYLSEFLSDPRVVDMPRWRWQPILQGIILSRRPFTSGRAYRSIWNTQADESPLLTITKAQTRAIAAMIVDQHGDQVVVDFCMRYGNPSVRTKVEAMVARGCRKILFFPLYPQYAGATTATANDAFFKCLRAQKWQPTTRSVGAYFSDPNYIDALAGSVDRAFNTPKSRPDILVASYHGMPQRFRAMGDPYYDQCLETTALLRQSLGWDNDQIITSFQSIFGVEEWLQPHTVQEVARLAAQGTKNIAVIAPAFSADCVETLEEIQVEICDAFKDAGGETFTYVPCLNDTPAHISALCKIIGENLSGWVKSL